ncbi:hypothetical protein LXL04_023949 [Taraxacum kok-saghyz]
MVANHRKWGLSVPYSTISVFSFQSCGLTIIRTGPYIYLGFNKPSDHGQLRDGETQTRASHIISHDPTDYLALGVRNRSICECGYSKVIFNLSTFFFEINEIDSIDFGFPVSRSEFVFDFRYANIFWFLIIKVSKQQRLSFEGKDGFKFLKAVVGFKKMYREGVSAPLIPSWHLKNRQETRNFVMIRATQRIFHGVRWNY